MEKVEKILSDHIKKTNMRNKIHFKGVRKGKKKKTLSNVIKN